MNAFQQRIPSYVEGMVPHMFNFKTTEELLEKECIQQYARGSWVADKKFIEYRLSWSGNIRDKGQLIAVYDSGNIWTIGTIWEPSLVDLPKWNP